MKENFIKFAPLFSGLIDSDREILAAAFTSGQGAAQSTLLRAGERSDSIFLIGEGFAALTTQTGQNLATLGPGSLIGEASMLRMMPQEFNAVALSDIQYWKLTDRKLREIILHHPSIGIKLSQNFGGMVAQMEDYLVHRLSQVTELSHLPPNTLQAIAARLRAREARSGETLYRAGDMPSSLFILESGSVELSPDSSATPGEQPQTLEPGSLFGSLALLTNKPYMQSAQAHSDALLWVLPADEFHQIAAQHPGLRRSLARTARTHLGKADQAQAMLRLAQMPLFAEVPPAAMQAIAQRMILQHVPAGERVYTMGDAGDALYLIEQGEVGLTGENAGGVVEELGRIQQGGFFGEMCLLTGQARTEDAMAVRNTNLWILLKSDLDELADQYPAIGKAISQGLATRLSTEDQSSSEERFRNFELLEGLGETELKQVVANLRPMRYRAGEQIYRAATAADTLFLLEKGTVRIQPLSGGTMLLGPGEAFGERALLTNQPHNATAIAETDVDVWTLSKQDFDALMNRYPSLAISMSRILSQRLAQVASGTSLEPPDVHATRPIEPVPAPATNMPSRRRRAAQYDYDDDPSTRPSEERISFAQWFANLTPFGKIRLALFILLLIWLLGIAAPAALLSLIQGTSAAGSEDLITSILYADIADLIL